MGLIHIACQIDSVTYMALVKHDQFLSSFPLATSVTRKSGLILVRYSKCIVFIVAGIRTSSLNISCFPVTLCQYECLDVVETFTSTRSIYLSILINCFNISTGVLISP